LDVCDGGGCSRGAVATGANLAVSTNGVFAGGAGDRAGKSEQHQRMQRDRSQHAPEQSALLQQRLDEPCRGGG